MRQEKSLTVATAVANLSFSPLGQDRWSKDGTKDF